MALLFQAKQKTQKSICELLRRAVHAAYGDIKIEKEDCKNEEEK